MTSEDYSKIALEAKRYFSIGLKCFPIHIFYGREKEKRMIFGPKNSEFSGWSCEHTFEIFKLRMKALAGYNKSPNSIGIITGIKSGIMVLDSDSLESEKYLSNQNIPDCPVAKTRRGFHRYFKYFSETRCIVGNGLHKGIDIKSDAGFVIAPPSLFIYQWIKNITSVDDLPAFPARLIGLFYGQTMLKKKTVYNKPIFDRPVTIDELEKSLQSMNFDNMDYDTWLKCCSAIWSKFDFEASWPLIKRHHPGLTAEYDKYKYKYDHRIYDMSYGYFINRAKENMTRQIDRVVSTQKEQENMIESYVDMVYRSIIETLEKEGCHSKILLALEKEPTKDRRHDMICDYCDEL